MAGEAIAIFGVIENCGEAGSIVFLALGKQSEYAVLEQGWIAKMGIFAESITMTKTNGPQINVASFVQPLDSCGNFFVWHFKGVGGFLQIERCPLVALFPTRKEDL